MDVTVAKAERMIDMIYAEIKAMCSHGAKDQTSCEVTMGYQLPSFLETGRRIRDYHAETLSRTQVCSKDRLSLVIRIER